MTIPYQLGPGDAVPFPGSDVEAEQNLRTHNFVLVPNPMPAPSIPKAWSDKLPTNAKPFPDMVERCSNCLMYAPSEAVKYPCGKTVRFSEGEYLLLRRPPAGWIIHNRIEV